MTVLADDTRKLWLWLLHQGGRWTAQELAQRTGGSSTELFKRMHAMTRRGLLEQFAPAPGSRYKQYGVTGKCVVPTGLCVGEVQA